MLKYTGSFDKLKDYGFKIEEDYFIITTKENEYRYVNENPKYNISLVIVDNENATKEDIPQHRDIYLISNGEDVVSVAPMTLLYTLIKDGLVIKVEE
jgi:hypothetical protein